MGRKVLIIGGGAAGLMAACSSAESGNDVTVIEKMPRPARKLMITGKGRCNVTNDADLNTLINSMTKNGRFLYSAFSEFTVEDTKAFFENAGVTLKTERGNRVFPKSDKAVDIVDALVNTAKKCSVKIINDNITSISVTDGKVMGAIGEKGNYPADSVIVATGGKSYPLTGSTGDGYEFAKSLGHTVTELIPSLVPIIIREDWCSTLQGLSLKNVSLSFYEEGKKKPIYTDFGEMMFTHFGITGPMVLSASAHLRKNLGKGYKMEIDLKPALSNEVLDKRLVSDLTENSNKNLINALENLLPKRLIPVVIAKAGLDRNIKANQLSRENREALLYTLKHLSATTAGFRPIEEAIVTGGGIKVSEINPTTMESKLISGLYFAGEVIDVDAYTGGFNLQIAFSTGYIAGKNA